MKTLSFLSALAAFVFSQSAIAQDWSSKVYKRGEIYPGYIIKLDGDTLQGHIQYENQFENQKEISFFSDPKDKKNKVKYKAEDLKGYKMADKEYRSLAYSGGLVAKPIRFVLIVKDGRICQYTWYDRPDNMVVTRGPNETVEDFEKRQFPPKEVFAKGAEKPFDNTAFGLKPAKFWSEIMSDYPELSSKIANKEKGYGFTNMYAFIEEYNTWWANKK